MALNPRQRRLLEFVREHETVSVEELARQFAVTPQTVRRDLKAMEGAKLLSRYHGGVGLASSVENIDYGQRRTLHLAAKRGIAAEVARHVQAGSSLLINIGTTTEEVARALLKHERLHVITNNPNVAAILCDSPSSEVILAGGAMRKRDRAVVGELACDFIRQFKVDIGIIGISSIEADGTLRDFDPREVRVAQTIIEQSRQVWLVADGNKYGRDALIRVGHISQVDKLFTDTPPPEPLAKVMKSAGVELMLAPSAQDQA
ncbi:MAG TPA: DeoR/GlpR family DNA-binding transcription regulator [Noviherbaspirillum sp.]|uniref:DeoR/GlpR family DNA-binding transcription regulator n=1 Tax=Noviherbaspirillum sp. TaxID=1926288 RepID=UPI002D558128|nr:DeoR/GlpR family DNA-binding transcription regulator [Noviherbaspirillum sp.]HYD97112.1 DeoR/GlpR family DNA-binding transcription regulator [Noviherbaspirillum sp.]